MTHGSGLMADLRILPSSISVSGQAAGLQVTEGHIEDLRFYGDFLSLTSLDGTVEALRGVPYRRREVEKILKTLPLDRCFGSLTPQEILDTIFA